MIARLILQTLILYGTMGLVLFPGAGTIYWFGAWLFLAEMTALFIVGGLWLAWHDPALLRERLAPPIQDGQPTADKLLLNVIILVIFGTLLLIALDAIRFAWSSVPLWVRVIGEFGLLFSAWVVYRTLRENTFAAPVVKIQEERMHTVVTTGPYGYVRHPMYAGTLIFLLGTSLLLGAWSGVAGCSYW